MLKHFKDVPYKVCLTGTPMGKDEMDFLQQYKFVMGDRVPFDYWKFRNYFTTQVRFVRFVTSRGRAVLDEVAKVCAFSLRRKDVNMDKEKIFEVRTVTLPPDARKVYKGVEEEFLLEYQNERKLTKFVIEQYSIMRRICGGFVPSTEEKGLVHHIHDAKLKELQTILDENFADEPVLIFANYIAEVDMIAHALKCPKIDGTIKAGKDRWDIEKLFKTGKTKRLVVQPNAVKEGVDLSVASTSIYYSLPSGYIVWKQTQDRILSLKKEGSLLLIILEVEGTIEEDMWKSLDKMTSKEDIILNNLRKKINFS
jgi:superfamily II DNA or RNA helicase